MIAIDTMIQYHQPINNNNNNNNNKATLSRSQGLQFVDKSSVDNNTWIQFSYYFVNPCSSRVVYIIILISLTNHCIDKVDNVKSN